jgi:hypothetical protein
LDRATIENKYLSSGIMRKIINIRAEDSVRDWREWQAEADEIERITLEEKRLNLQNVIKQVEILRGLGGGAIYMGLPGEPTMPAPAKIGAGQLAYVHVLNRWQLTPGKRVEDVLDPLYGEPSMFDMETTSGQVSIHPSRIVIFKGARLPSLTMRDWIEDYWGESLVAAYCDDVDNYEAVKVALMRMVSKAGYMRVFIPELSRFFETTESEATLSRRVSAIAGNATALDAVVLDGGNGADNPGERVEDASISLSGVIDTLNGFASQIAAVTDIPITRLLGKSATGMNSSGDSEQKDWNKSVMAYQTLSIDPCLAQFDKYLLPSAGVKAAVSYVWQPLSMPTQGEEAIRFNTTMDAVAKLQNTGAIPDLAFSKGLQSLMTEEGWLPGLAGALADMPEAERFPEGPLVDPDTGQEVDPNEITQEAE